MASKVTFHAVCGCGVYTGFSGDWVPTPAHARSRRHREHVARTSATDAAHESRLSPALSHLDERGAERPAESE